MTREEQDKIWNDLSQESRDITLDKYKSYVDKYKNDDDEELRDFGRNMKMEYECIFGSHNLNPKPLTYEDVAKELFGDKKFMTVECHFTSYKQAKKLLAINKLLNVAKYLNGDWKPDWENIKEEKWSFFIENDKLKIAEIGYYSMNICFRTEELAQQAIQILGEETIRLALSTDY